METLEDPDIGLLTETHEREGNRWSFHGPTEPVDPDQYMWGGLSRGFFDRGPKVRSLGGGLCPADLSQLIQNIVAEDSGDGEALYLLDCPNLLVKEIQARINHQGLPLRPGAAA